MTRHKIVIAGAGIGGLTAEQAFCRQGMMLRFSSRHPS